MAAAAGIEGLIAGTGRGGRRATAALYRVAAPALYGRCLRLMPEEPAAAALLEAAFEAIVAAASQCRGSGLAPGDWLARTLREAAVPVLRRSRAALPGADPDGRRDLADLPPVLDPAGRAVGGPLLPLLARLPPDEGEAVARALFAGESEAELARRFGLPPAALRALMAWALAGLDAALDAGPDAGRDAGPGPDPKGDAAPADPARAALGLIEGDELAAFLRACAADPVLRARRARWDAAVAAATAAPPVPPPAGVWPRIERRLFPEDAGGLLARLGVIPALVAALIGALLVAAVQGPAPGPTPGPAPGPTSGPPESPPAADRMPGTAGGDPPAD